MSTRDTTVLFFKDLYKTLEAIPDEDAGILMKALFAHANGEPEDLKDSTFAKALYPMIEDQMDRLEEYRQTKAESGRLGGINSGAKRSKREANVKQNEANVKQNEPPYPYPYPSPEYIARSARVQKAYGFSTERTNINYNDLIKERLRKEAEE